MYVQKMKFLFKLAVCFHLSIYIKIRFSLCASKYVRIFLKFYMEIQVNPRNVLGGSVCSYANAIPF